MLVVLKVINLRCLRKLVSVVTLFSLRLRFAVPQSHIPPPAFLASGFWRQ